MKLITLNILRGQMKEPLKEFLKKYAGETDIFLFQELPSTDGENLEWLTAGNIKNILSDFISYSKDFSRNQGHLKDMAIFVRDGIKIKEKGEVEIHDSSIFNEPKEHLWRDLEYVIFDDKKLLVNFHGLWDGPDKYDRPCRVEQSKKVKEFLDKYSGPKILAGDFNLWPETESLKILEEGMVNLIDEYRITSIRPSFINYPNKYAGYSDYVFVSPEIKVNAFKVLPDEVSDHLALMLDFDPVT